MKLNIPESSAPLIKITARTGEWSRRVFVSSPYGSYEIAIPDWIDEREVELTIEPCNSNEQPIDRAVVLKEAVPRLGPRLVGEDVPVPIKKSKYVSGTCQTEASEADGGKTVDNDQDAG